MEGFLTIWQLSLYKRNFYRYTRDNTDPNFGTHSRLQIWIKQIYFTKYAHVCIFDHQYSVNC